ncbi:hypothetical protein BT63DRAFT_414166 [Microthyrium microscopicum]|uniref:Mid2 domain-containing protein n=1 Tax=Microthyrium microscopicum TaxID=703497 RepID=A0A6A6U7K7_9PEZI|nr:hypothetical protein BT63DRAFT_414166 [Microthyrium microscopicum]
MLRLLFANFVLRTVLAADYGGFFSPQYNNKGEPPSWVLGSSQTLSWNTTLSNYNVTLWQNIVGKGSGRADKPVFVITNAAGPQIRQWTVDIQDFSLDDSPVFLFWLNYTGSESGPNGLVSSYFNITRDAASSSTTSSRTSSATSVAGPSSSSSSNSSLPSSPNANTNDGGLSSGAKVGLGVGLGIGMPLLIALGVLIGLLLRKNHKATPTTAASSAFAPYDYQSTAEKLYQPNPSPVQQYPYEAPDAAHMQGQSLNPAELEAARHSHRG